MRVTPLWISLLWSLVEVHCQTVPYVFFMNETLPNHGYVNLTLVGNPDLDPPGPSVQCRTDLSSCCSEHQGRHRGDWYFPDGSRLPLPGQGDITESRVAQQVELRVELRRNSPSGIYRCGIETDAVRDISESAREAVYVGLYVTGGMNLYTCIY